MADSPASDLVVSSHKGPYAVECRADPFAELLPLIASGAHFIIDARVADLYDRELRPALNSGRVLRVEATEERKSIEAMPQFVRHLAAKGVRRGQTLVAVGGGVIQDITCFLAATMLRGMDWVFVPTTLLAMADSCIGSKSSINGGGAKNILGTFTPPKRVLLAVQFLRTLDEKDIRSGVGEMLKVHAIDGPASFDRIAADYPRLFADASVMTSYLIASLAIKKPIVESDEFDTGPRLVMNYGHSFGHALESATGYAVPHGLAVTIGMDLANFVSARLGRGDASHYKRMRPTLAANWKGCEDIAVPLIEFLDALAKDKKNTAANLGLILPDRDGIIRKMEVPSDEKFRAVCAEYLAKGRKESLL
ncbi:MAG: AroB-related putative sugar phosphate phospholyase (cyclizing) [Elusimicrobiota bacterium]